MSFFKNLYFKKFHLWQSEESPQKVGPKDKEILLGDTTNQKVKISVQEIQNHLRVGLEGQNRENRKKEVIKELIQEDLPD